MSRVPTAPRAPQEAFSIQGMQQSLFPGVSRALEIKDSQERPRAHLLQPETSSLPLCPARAAGDLPSIKPLQRATSHLEEEKEWGNNHFLNVLIPYPSSTSFSGLPSGALMEGQLSAGSCRPGKERCRLQNREGRERQSWCQLGMLMQLSRPRSHVPKH